MEVREIGEFLRQNNLSSVIIVTSKPHTRRVRAIWNRLVDSDTRAIVRFANDDPYDGSHWWRIREMASTSFASLLACSMPGQAFPFVRVRTDNARQSPQANEIARQ